MFRDLYNARATSSHGNSLVSIGFPFFEQSSKLRIDVSVLCCAAVVGDGSAPGSLDEPAYRNSDYFLQCNVSNIDLWREQSSCYTFLYVVNKIQDGHARYFRDFLGSVGSSN